MFGIKSETGLVLDLIYFILVNSTCPGPLDMPGVANGNGELTHASPIFLSLTCMCFRSKLHLCAFGGCNSLRYSSCEAQTRSPGCYQCSSRRISTYYPHHLPLTLHGEAQIKFAHRLANQSREGGPIGGRS